jgi:hypothetical protein
LSSTSESVVTIELNTRNRIEIERGCGSEIDTTGDGVLALFDSPTPAGMCPLALIAATGLDLAIRAAVHSGEYERSARASGDLAGPRRRAGRPAPTPIGSASPRRPSPSSTKPSFQLESPAAHEFKGVTEPVDLLSVRRNKPASQPGAPREQPVGEENSNRYGRSLRPRNEISYEWVMPTRGSVSDN